MYFCCAISRSLIFYESSWTDISAMRNFFNESRNSDCLQLNAGEKSLKVLRK